MDMALEEEEVDNELLKMPIYVDPALKRPRSRSEDIQYDAIEPDNLLDKARQEVVKKASLLWDNKFFDRLFPSIKQQKPGLDLYVGIAGTSIIIILYIILLYSPMSGTKSSTIS